MPLIDVPEQRTRAGGEVSDEARRLARLFALADAAAPDPAAHTGLRPGKYWACTRPECPPTQWVSWSHLCRACIVHGVAVLYNDPADAERVVRFTPTVRSAPKLIRHGDLLAFLSHQLGDAYLAEHVPGGDLARACRSLGYPVPDGIENTE